MSRLGQGLFIFINEFIVRHKLDFLFLTETWLDQTNSAAALLPLFHQRILGAGSEPVLHLEPVISTA